MSAVLTRIDDPRDNLEKMTRDELWYYARANGVTFPEGHNTPATNYTSDGRPSMVSILRARGLTGNVDTSQRWPGNPFPLRTDPPPSSGKSAEADAQMRFQDLRRLCTEKGIKWALTDKKEALLEKLHGHENAS